MIFKQIDSSVDKTRKTLALFNKDWNTYKSNWQNANGIKGKIGSIFTSSNTNTSIISNEQVQILRNWNNAVTHGCTSQETFNRIIANADDNTKMYFAGLNKGKGSIEGLKKAQNVATQSTIGLTIAQTALNMAISLGLTALISLIVKGYDKLANSVENCKERVDDLISSYKSALETANNNANRVEELADKYEKLSKGVNSLGENVSLTNEEYEEYNSLVNEIAEMFPTLVQGWTDEGTAVLNLKGNIEQLRDAYKEAQQEAYNLLIVSGKDSDGNDIIKQWEDTHDTGFWADLLDLGADDVGGGIAVSDALKQLKAIQNMTAEEYREIERITGAGSRKEIAGLSDIEKDIGYGSYLYKALGLDSNVTDEAFREAQRQARVLIQTYNAEIESALSDVETLANAYLITNEDYDKLDEQSKTAASMLVNSLNADIANTFSSKEDVGVCVDKIVQSILSNSKAKDALKGLFTMDTSDMSVDEIKKQTDSYINTIAEVLKEDPIELKTRLGFDDSDTQQLINNVKEKLQDDFDDKVGELTLDELKIAAEQVEVPDVTLLSWDELIAKIKEVQDSTSNIENPISSFTDAFDSMDTDIQEKLLDLARSGEITASVFESTEEYAELLTKTGLSADSAKDQILDMLSVQEKLAGAANGLEKLKSSYEEFKELGFVTAQSLGELPDAFKELEGYNLFTEIAGDPAHGKETIQQAFNDIVREYIISQGTLSGLVNASEADIQSYIANLKEMGITNAEEVVNATIQVLNQENELLNVAESEYADYLNAKEGYDDAYIKSVASKNGQLVSKLGEAYKGDYENWCNLMKQKAEVYNRFVRALNASGIIKPSGSPLTDKGFAEQQADKILKDTANGTKNIYDPKSVKGTYFPQKPGTYTREQVNMARQIKNMGVEQNRLYDQIKLDLSEIDEDFAPDYSPKGSGSKDKKEDSKKEETKREFSEIFDWIERRIKKLQSSFDRWIEQAETAFTSKTVGRYYNKAASVAKTQLTAYKDAYTRYMKQAASVGLDEGYAAKVRNGTMDIESIYAYGTEEEIKKYEENADKIKAYQDWYDKAQDAMDSFIETAEKLANIPLEKAARKAEIFSKNIDLIDKRLENATGSKSKNKLIDKQSAQEKKTNKANNDAKDEATSNLRSAKKTLKKKKYLDADDGISKKEREKIKKAMKANEEVNLSFFTKDSSGYRAVIRYNEALKAQKKAAHEAALSQEEYNRYLVEAAKQKFDNVADDYDKKVQLIRYRMSARDNKIAELEAAGKNVNISYYRSQLSINGEILAQKKEEKKELLDSLKYIREGTDEWYDAKDAIQSVNDEISECTKNTYELNNAINQLRFDLYDETSEGINRIIMEQEFLRGLFAHEKKVDDKTGGFTEAGIANLGTLSADYYASVEKSKLNKDIISELQQVKKKGKQKDGSYKYGDWTFNSLDDLLASIEKYTAEGQEIIKEQYGYQVSINEIMKERYQAELDMLKERIGSKKEALDIQKDIHDYSRTIREKTDAISTIQKQIAAYSGDTSEEGRAKLQKLQKELSDKQDDLKETEYDRFISDQKDMLDKLYEEYEDAVEKKMDDFMALVEEGLGTANKNMATTNDFLKEIANRYGYKTEFKNVHNKSKGDTQQNVSNASDKVAEGKKNLSGTEQKKSEEDKNMREKASAFIKDHATDAKKDRKKYSDVNKKIYDDERNDYDGTGKVLSEKDLKQLAKELGVKYNGAGKNSNLYKKLNKIGYFDKSNENKSLRSKAKAYIKKHASKAGKKKEKYSDVNQKIYEDKADSYKGTGKILSTKELKGLAKVVGVKYDNATEKGSLYKKLKSIRFPGFSKGGVVSVDDIEKQVRANGDTGLISANKGEALLTERQTEMFREFIGNMDNLSKPAIKIQNPVDYLRDVAVSRGMNSVVNIDTLTLPNITNYEEFKSHMMHDIQTEKKTGMVIREVAGINQLAGNGRLGNIRHNI